jgi:hypothetical protein
MRHGPRLSDVMTATLRPLAAFEIGARARLPRWLIGEKQLPWELPWLLRFLPQSRVPLGVTVPLFVGGVPDGVGYGTQAHGGICWAFAIRQLPPQGIG